MTTPPARPLIYHITHVSNLPSIIANGGLLSDKIMIARGGPTATIGMGSIKHRRLNLPVKCFPGEVVGDYVPFYFCPRSVMLYVIHMANNPDLGYRGGQGPIVHLEADLHDVINWATANRRRWAFSLSNAGAGYSEFRSDVANLSELDWPRIASTDFRSSAVKEAKQCEFLVRDEFPFHLMSRIGVCSMQVLEQVERSLLDSSHRPRVAVEPAWYY